MSTVPRTSAALATAVIDTLFYGSYVVLFLTSIYLVFTAQSRGMRRERSIWLSPILCGGSVLFIAITGHWVLTIDRLFLAFAVVDEGANPVGFYVDFSQPTQIMQSSFLLASLTIVDALFVHRLWTVWGHNRHVIIFPAITLLGLAASTVGVAVDFFHFRPGDNVLQLANGWIIADCGFTVFTNIYCTALIGWRLWRVQSILKPAGRSFMSIITILIESAALSTTWAIFFVTAYAARSNLRFLIDVTPAIVGTANMLIYVRVGLGWAFTPSAPSATSAAIPLRLRRSKPGTSTRDDTVTDDDPDGRVKKHVGLV
ncbi:hypothetical protein C8R47DRAFT_40739 [Mycena vitilis]|nr:hypothetical protein C8R47DRAFT_40739 [Mycena vitilis]